MENKELKEYPIIPKKIKIKGVNDNSCCLDCEYFLAGETKSECSCFAYAIKEIPLKFLQGKKVHNKIEPGQRGDFIYTPKPVYYRR